MKHLQFPFAENVSIEITNGRKKVLVECELSSSEIEIFQSLWGFSPKTFLKARSDFASMMFILFIQRSI
jgi:hypothetical protein